MERKYVFFREECNLNSCGVFYNKKWQHLLKENMGVYVKFVLRLELLKFVRRIG